MTTRKGKIHVVPTGTRSALPLFARPHFIRYVAGNGETVWHSHQYVTRASGVRAGRKAADGALWVYVYNAAGTVVREIGPTR